MAAESEYISRRSPVLGRRGMAASSQPLATEAGLRTLQAGGTAADAAVAMAAALQVTEPCSTGLGGDAFVLWYDGKRRIVESLQAMATGTVPDPACAQQAVSPKGLTLELVHQRGHKRVLPAYDALTVTVPGAAAAWVDTVAKYGRLSLGKVLEPAIQLAEEGWPVSPIISRYWASGTRQLLNAGPNAGELLMDGMLAPKAGDVMHNPTLGNTFRLLAEHGKKGFYEGPVAQAIVDVLQSLGGVMTLEDLALHTTALEKPICSTYRGITVWEVPPPTQGIAALLALNILEAYTDNISKQRPVDFGSIEFLHASVEAMRLSFADTLTHVADPLHHSKGDYAGMISKSYAQLRAKSIVPDKAATVTPGPPPTGADTVYFCVVDGEGNGCSMINSNYMGFGTGIVPKGCGFTLQNRGHNFSLDPSHPNCLGPHKRPYHTIMPGLSTFPAESADHEAGALHSVFGVMGGFMQPQGHLQVLSNVIDLKLNPQAALDRPRFAVTGLPSMDRGHGPHPVESSQLELEAGEGRAEVAEVLASMGHQVELVTGPGRGAFGRGQMILKNPVNGVLWAGSEGRADGCAMGW